MSNSSSFKETKFPLVSVVVTTYNHKNHIAQCLDGVLAQQTNFPFEVILGEDESNDGTREVCIDYAAKNPDKIKLFLRSRKDTIYINGNPTGRFNFIENLKAATGKYIALCDGDDYWTDPLKLQKQVDFLEANPDYGICFHRANLLKNNQLSLHEIPDIKRGHYTFSDLLEHYNFIATASVMFKIPKDFKIPNWFSKASFGDISLYALVSEHKKIMCLPEVMSVYRIGNTSVYHGQNFIKQQLNYLTFYKVIHKHLNKDNRLIVSRKRHNLIKKLASKKYSSSFVKKVLYYTYLRIFY